MSESVDNTAINSNENPEQQPQRDASSQVNIIENTNATTADESEIAEMRAKMEEMEQESAKLREMQQQLAQQSGMDIDSVSGEGNTGTSGPHSDDPSSHIDIEQRQEIDSRSVFVGNVDYSSLPEELQEHFKDCGSINRITIATNKHTGNPKGFAYIEFADPASVKNALELNESLFKGRMLKVIVKRTNLPGFSRGGGRGRGRGRGGFRGRFRGRARGRGGFRPY
ncbi:unnamed protein product [Ambrosiozyma monospora]|uniref:Unnamed protein product n=1 Tax=Ambrosiozyma monospora TaxID=43982 RepID=A0ACB5T9M1_AMBMO|nr:unnamed protein product [Ambrosiozyma monospora]